VGIAAEAEYGPDDAPGGRGQNPPMLSHPLDGLRVFERGWLSSNNVLIHPAHGERGAVLVDAGHVNHAAQTVALVGHALGETPLARIVNTHLHSDHCGGNAALQRAFGAQATVPPGHAEELRRWDEAALSYRATGQRIERFDFADTSSPGTPLVAGGREWQVLAAPGHDPHSVLLFDAGSGLLLSADALWENGFGVVFPELVGEPAFDDVRATLEMIAALPVKLVVPGHGAPFNDATAALQRARVRLAGMQAQPAKHAAHALKVLLKYHLMEERRQALPDLLDWVEATPLTSELWMRFAPRGLASLRDWTMQALEELAARGVVRREGEVVVDA